MMPLKDKDKLVAVDGEKERLSGTEAAIDKVQAQKTAVEALDVETAVEAEAEKTDKRPESDDDRSSIEYLAKLLNLSDDWIQKRRQQQEEHAARSKRIMEHFVKHHVKDGRLVEEEDEEEDEEYDARWARMQAISAELWSQHNDFSGLDVYIPEEDDTMAPPASSN